MHLNHASSISRRQFLTGAGAALSAPFILPSGLRGATAPSNRINIGMIGCGRMAQGHLQSLVYEKTVRIAALCDVDSLRLQAMAGAVRQWRPDEGKSVRQYRDYRELLSDSSVDAVLIATPDHQHAIVAIEAALAGKDIYLEKPLTLTLAEGRALSDVVRSKKRILQVGSQQRSLKQFARACELVRNGRIGKLRTIDIGLPLDNPGGRIAPMPVPQNLDYDRWLGPVQALPYTEDRVHPQKGYGRPGWLACEDFTCGMITGWGSHHVDIAHWAMGIVDSGPVEVSAKASFLTGGLWNVHGEFEATLSYANGVKVHVGGKRMMGVRFEGESGWIYVNREDTRPLRALDASDRAILKKAPAEREVHLVRKADHHGDWLDCIRTRQEPIAPVEVGHRSCSACLVAHIAMKTGRTLAWDPVRERFIGDEEADRMFSRPARDAYSIERILKAANFVKSV